jgi:hypothetical protein
LAGEGDAEPRMAIAAIIAAQSLAISRKSLSEEIDRRQSSGMDASGDGICASAAPLQVPGLPHPITESLKPSLRPTIPAAACSVAVRADRLNGLARGGRRG